MIISDTPKQILERFSHRVTLMPGLSNEEIRQFQTRLHCPLSSDIRELLSYSGGFHHHRLGDVHFTGVSGFDFPEAFPCSIALLADEEEDFWIVDVDTNTGAWGAIFFVSHDPPVFVVQASDIRVFLLQILDPTKSNPENALSYVRKKAVSQIWKKDSWLIPVQDVRVLQEPVASGFAKQLPDNFRIADLRSREIGSGFSWGLADPNADIRRCRTDLLFGVGKKPRSGLTL